MAAIYEAQLFSLKPGIDFPICVAPFIEEKIAALHQHQGPSYEVEAAAYKTIHRALLDGHTPDGVIFSDSNGPSLVVHNSFLEHHNQFVKDLILARQHNQAGNVAWSVVTKALWHGGGHLAGFNSFYGEPLPILCVQLDKLDDAANFIGIPPTTLKNGLDETPYWKTSDPMVLAHSSQPGHDYPGYIDQQRGDEDVEVFLQRSDIHERLHLFVDPISLRFHTYHNWLTEGFANLFGSLAIPIRNLRTLHGWPDIHDVMRNNDPTLKYHGGQLAVALMGAAIADMHPSCGESWSAGVFKLLALIADHPNPNRGIEGLNNAVNHILGHQIGQVTYWWNSLAHSIRHTPLTIQPLDPFHPFDPINA